MPKIIKSVERTQTCPSCGSIWELESGESYLDECPVCRAYIEMPEPKSSVKERISVKERTIDAVMNELDFEKIHEVMEFLDWQWWNEGVPSLETIKKEAHRLLETAWEHKCSTGTGGFWVEYEEETEEDYPVLKISFELTWAGPCWVGKKDNEMHYA